MDKNLILSKLKELREKSKKRKFSQSIDLVINLKQIDIKKQENKIDLFIQIPNGKGKKVKICGLVDKELVKESKDNLDHTITKEEFQNLNNKQIKKIAREFDFFVAQANIMNDIAKFFGKTLGPKGKMPNPKSGCVIPMGVPLKPIKERLEKTIRLQTKNEAIIKTMVGKETMDDNEIADNVMAIYNNLLSALPQEKNNIQEVLIKLTMSNPIRLE